MAAQSYLGSVHIEGRKCRFPDTPRACGPPPVQNWMFLRSCQLLLYRYRSIVVRSRLVGTKYYANASVPALEGSHTDYWTEMTARSGISSREADPVATYARCRDQRRILEVGFCTGPYIHLSRRLGKLFHQSPLGRGLDSSIRPKRPFNAPLIRILRMPS